MLSVRIQTEETPIVEYHIHAAQFASRMNPFKMHSLI